MKTRPINIIVAILAAVVCLGGYASPEQKDPLSKLEPDKPFQGNGTVRVTKNKQCPVINYELHQAGAVIPLVARPRNQGFLDKKGLSLLKTAAREYPHKTVHVMGTVIETLDACRFIEVHQVTESTR